MSTVCLKYGSEVVYEPVELERLNECIPSLDGISEVDLNRVQITHDLSITAGHWGFLLDYVRCNKIFSGFPPMKFVLNVKTLWGIIKISHDLGMKHFLEQLAPSLLKHPKMVIDTGEQDIEESLKLFVELSSLHSYTQEMRFGKVLPDYFIDVVANILAEEQIWRFPHPLAKCWNQNVIESFINRSVVYYGKEENVYLTVEAWCNWTHCNAQTTLELLHALRPDSDDLKKILIERMNELGRVTKQVVPKKKGYAITGAFTLTPNSLICINIYTHTTEVVTIFPPLNDSNDSALQLPQNSMYLYKLIKQRGRPEYLILLKLPIKNCTPTWQYVSRCSLYENCPDNPAMLCYGNYCFVNVTNKSLIVFHLDGQWIIRNGGQKTIKDYLILSPSYQRMCNMLIARQRANVYRMYISTVKDNAHYTKECHLVIRTYGINHWLREIRDELPWIEISPVKYVPYPDRMDENEVPTLVRSTSNRLFAISSIKLNQYPTVGFYITLDMFELVEEDDDKFSWKKIELESKTTSLDMDLTTCADMLRHRTAYVKWLVFGDANDRIVIFGGDHSHPINPIFKRGTIVIDTDKKSVKLKKYTHVTYGVQIQCMQSSIC